MSEGEPGSPRNNSSAMSQDGFPKGKQNTVKTHTADGDFTNIVISSLLSIEEVNRISSESVVIFICLKGH